MAIKKAFWTPKAEESFDLIIEFIEYKWTDKEVKNFVTKAFKTISQIEKNPTMFVASTKKDIHKAVITKHNSIYYRILDQQIELLFLHSFSERQFLSVFIRYN